MLIVEGLTPFFSCLDRSSQVVRETCVEMLACLANIQCATALTFKTIHYTRSKTLGNSIL